MRRVATAFRQPNTLLCRWTNTGGRCSSSTWRLSVLRDAAPPTVFRRCSTTDTAATARINPAASEAAAKNKAGGRTASSKRDDEPFYFGLHVSRLLSAIGIAYVVTEYGVELTVCEGPSMLPTIRPVGEIVLIDRWTPRKLGLQGGDSGASRTRLARKRQLAYEDATYAQRMREGAARFRQEREARRDRRRTETEADDGSLMDADTDTDTDTDTGMSTEVDDVSMCTEEYGFRSTWHEPRIPANTYPVEGWLSRLQERQNTGISVGDVVVLHHPNRVGTVCKRVMGLPGDVVTKPNSRLFNRSAKRSLRHGNFRGRPLGEVVPDGHIWVEGDNPWNSSDSRNYGPIPASLIIGRVLLRIWPLRGNALMERGDRPVHYEQDGTTVNGGSEVPQLMFSGSLVLPAGYQDELIVSSCTEWERVRPKQRVGRDGSDVDGPESRSVAR